MGKNILWVSPHIPYDTVTHGGGKTHNYYIKYFQSTGKYNITLLSLCVKSDLGKIDLERYQIKYSAYILDKNPLENMFRRVVDRISYVNPKDPYAGICLNYERWMMNRQIKKYLSEGQKPDIVILQWTFAALFIDDLKKNFPDSKYIVIEEDVTFLNYRRRYERAQGRLNKVFWKNRMQIGQKKELEALQKADIVVTNNFKDSKLLVTEKLARKKIFTSAPYFDDYSCIERKKNSKNILFWGAMSRPENYESAIWFITNVMPLLKDFNVKFVIAGGQPNNSLYKYEREDVIITGYVKNPEDLFEDCFCLVAPLVGGAGIKIKILEALSAGVPVLTNEIGIEGIPAQDGSEYYLCKTVDDYLKRIQKLLTTEVGWQMGTRARLFIRKNYCLNEKLQELEKTISEL